MKKVLLGTTALLGVGLMAGTATAAEGIKLSLGGFFRTGYGMTFDDNNEANPDGTTADLGHDRNVDGVFNNSEVYFTGETTLDNGITVGVRMELEGETAGDQIDASYAYFSGGFGEIRIGSHAGAASNFITYPPGSSTNFGPHSPGTIGAVTSAGAGSIFIWDPEVNLAGRDKAAKITYFSPVWSGFSFAASYTPDANEERQTDGVNGTFHPDRAAGTSHHDVGLGLHYDYAGDGWGLGAGAAAYFANDKESTNGVNDSDQAYNMGLNVSVGGFTVGVASTITERGREDTDDWVIGTGISYNWDAWTVALGWSHFELEDGDPGNGGTGGDADIWNRVGATGNYAMGPGVNIDAGLFYTWGSEGADDTADSIGEALEDYDALEISVGTAISF